MKNLLKIEDLAEFFLGMLLFSQLGMTWWWFPALLLLPDLSMVGYAFGPKVGAWSYNFFHHKGTAIAVLLAGYVLGLQWLVLTGSILLSHAAMDRFAGYGLKFNDGFSHTHLGYIGKEKKVLI
jgi:hypothetical protein